MEECGKFIRSVRSRSFLLCAIFHTFSTSLIFPSFVLFLKRESRNFLLSLTVNFLFCARCKQHQANSEIDFQFLMTHVSAMENHRTSHYKRSVSRKNMLKSTVQLRVSFTMPNWINNNYQSWRIHDDWKLSDSLIGNRIHQGNSAAQRVGKES